MLDILDEFVIGLAACVTVSSETRVVSRIGTLMSVSLAAVRFATSTRMAVVTSRVRLRLSRALRWLFLRNLQLVKAWVTAVRVCSPKLVFTYLSILGDLLSGHFGVLVWTFVTRALPMWAMNWILLKLVVFNIKLRHEPIEVDTFGTVRISLTTLSAIWLMTNLTWQTFSSNGLFWLHFVFICGLALTHFHILILELILVIPYVAGILFGVGFTSLEVILFVPTFCRVHLGLLIAACILDLGCATILSGVFYRWNFEVGNIVSL